MGWVGAKATERGEVNGNTNVENDPGRQKSNWPTTKHKSA